MEGHKDVPAGCGQPCAVHFGSRRNYVVIQRSIAARLRMTALRKVAVATSGACSGLLAASRPPPRSTPTVPMSSGGFVIWASRRSHCRSLSHLPHVSIRCTASSTSSCSQSGQTDLNLDSMCPLAASLGANGNVPVRILTMACHPGARLLCCTASSRPGNTPCIPAASRCRNRPVPAPRTGPYGRSHSQDLLADSLLDLCLSGIPPHPPSGRLGPGALSLPRRGGHHLCDACPETAPLQDSPHPRLRCTDGNRLDAQLLVRYSPAVALRAS